VTKLKEYTSCFQYMRHIKLYFKGLHFAKCFSEYIMFMLDASTIIKLI